MADDVALHVGIAESDVAELDLGDDLRHREGAGRRQDGGVELEELEEIADEETAVVETRDGCHEGGEVALAATESLEEHDERAYGDGARPGAADEHPDDGEHGGGLDERAEDVEEAETAGDGEEAAYEEAAGLDEAGAEERGEAVGAELLGEIASGEDGAIVGGAAVELCVVAPEAVDAASLVEPDGEGGDDSDDHDGDDPPGGGDEHGDDADDGDGGAEEGHDIVENLERAEGGFLLGAVEGVVVGGVVVELHVELSRLPLEEVAEVVDEALGEDIVVDAVESGDDAVEQEDETHDDEESHCLETKAAVTGDGGGGDRIDEQLEDVEVDQWKETLQHHIEHPEPEGTRVAAVHHEEGFPEILHTARESVLPDIDFPDHFGAEVVVDAAAEAFAAAEHLAPEGGRLESEAEDAAGELHGGGEAADEVASQLTVDALDAQLVGEVAMIEPMEGHLEVVVEGAVGLHL